MTITVKQLAIAINGKGRITPESKTAVPGMSTWAIDVMNEYCHIIDTAYHTGWHQEEAEKIARDHCTALHGFTWQVICIDKH